MVGFPQIFASLSEQTKATLSRSDVLRTLVWPMGILVIALVGLAATKDPPRWLLITLAVLAGAFFLLYGVAFVFCLVRNPDDLRSESYSIRKLEIQHAVVGDSNTGLLELEDDGSVKHGKTKRSDPPPQIGQS